jgi:hypothetical protein
VFCESLQLNWESRGIFDRLAVLFVDWAPRHGHVVAPGMLRPHGVHLLAFPPHPAHVLHSVDACRVRGFKAEFVKPFRA